MIKFEENEYFLVAMFQKESRQATIEEMLALINSTLEKLWFLTDEAFLSLELESYRKEPMEDE